MFKQYGSIAKLVDAPDSKSGHFGGMGFVFDKFTGLINHSQWSNYFYNAHTSLCTFQKVTNMAYIRRKKFKKVIVPSAF